MSRTGKTSIDRRRFLAGAAAAAAALCVPDVGYGRRKTLPPFCPLPLLADLHVHPLLDNWVENSYVGKANEELSGETKSLLNKTEARWARAWQAGVDVLCVAHYDMFNEFATMPTDPNPDAPRQALRQMDHLEVLLRTELESYAELARTPMQLERILGRPKADGDGSARDPRSKIAVVHALEGGHHLGAEPKVVETFAKRGVAMITVTHFFNKGAGAAGNPLPFFPDAFAPPDTTGLTELGADMVHECEKWGVIPDVSHGTRSTVSDILERAKKPVVATHSSASALGDHPYSLADEHIQEIARKGGVVGVILMPHWLGNYATAADSHEHGGLDDAVRTVLHMMKICGGKHDHIGIGSDFKGYIPGPYDMEAISQVSRLRRKLETVLGTEVVDDILVNNAVRLLTRCWGKPCD